MRNPFRAGNKGSVAETYASDSPEESKLARRSPNVNGCTEEQLQVAFDKAAASLESSVGTVKLDQDDLLMLYGLYKQATSGPCTTFRPSFFDLKARSKW